MRTRRHLKEVRRRCGGERPTADARRPYGDRGKLMKIERRRSSRRLQVCRIRDNLRWINVWPKLLLRHTGGGFDCEDVLCWEPVGHQPLSHRRLPLTDQPAESRLRPSSSNSLRKCRI
jgi:hypothetical protein